jgi:hypothetical protein
LKLPQAKYRAAVFVLALAAGAFAATFAAKPASARDKDKPKSATAAQVVDKGSFGVIIRGQRVVTETFNVRQENGVSIVTAELKETAGATPTAQKSFLEFSPKGELLRYEWSQSGAASGSLTVVPNNDFLLEKITTSGSSKAAEQAFLMPTTTLILDNNFFIHREVLAWRYLATAACHGDAGTRQCQPEEYGALVPQDRSSLRVRMELVGKEKVMLHGGERELLRVNLRGDGFDWALWLDDHDQFKLIKVAIPADNTEVVRD